METKTLTFRKAAASDLDAVTAIYDRLHAQEDAGRVTIGWAYAAEDRDVFVLHTLTVDPDLSGRGIGCAFVQFYEDTARALGCTVLRMDTNEKNAAARRLYARLGYREADIVPCAFNSIPDVRLVLLEKRV